MDYYTEAEFLSAKKRKNVLLAIFFVVLGLYVAASIVLFIWYLQLPYQSPKIATVKWIHYPTTAVVAAALFFYMSVPFKRANRYYKMLFNMKTGVRETNTGSFFEYDETLQEKDGVDCKSLIFLEWNKYKNDIFERKVLVFYDRPFPEFKEKDSVRFVTQGNVLISYEIL